MGEVRCVGCGKVIEEGDYLLKVRFVDSQTEWDYCCDCVVAPYSYLEEQEGKGDETDAVE